jgi:adenine-specific DNA-methyltransferase
MATPSGRLELTWTNKPLRLLAHEDDSYEWVPPSDYRVAEVRLLNDAGTAGDVHADAERANDNLLIRGDALSALTSLIKIPEFRDAYVGNVKLAYLDPPFNTGEIFPNYNDALEHSVWLTVMRDRLLQIKKLLAKNGSVWVHCDDYEQHRVRCVLDEVFGASAFVATILWQKRYSRDNRPAIGPVHDFIHVYAPMGTDWKKVRNRIPRVSAKEYRNPNNDPNGLWRPIPLDAQAGHATEAQFYEIVTPGGAVHPPPKGRCWSVTKPRFDELVAEGRVYFGLNGRGKPNLIRYLKDDEGLVPWTWWPHEEVGHNDESKKEILTLFPDHEPFDTPKPERLMQRIVHIASEPGDIVLDAFAGSATTAAVAHKMGRRWVTVEWKRETIETYAAPRLMRVVRGDDPGGITEEMDWAGGGGFRVLDVAPSMFADDAGHVVLADWAVNGALAEATAAQFGFAYDTELLPFCGRKGRTRLAVVDGLVNEDVARLLVEQLPEDEMVVLCGTMIDPAAQQVLATARKGSRLRKIPDSILADYRRGQLWWEQRMADLLDLSENGAGAGTEPAVEESVQA